MLKNKIVPTKLETHNTPDEKDPAETGIGGKSRDTLVRVENHNTPAKNTEDWVIVETTKGKMRMVVDAGFHYSPKGKDSISFEGLEGIWGNKKIGSNHRPLEEVLSELITPIIDPITGEEILATGIGACIGNIIGSGQFPHHDIYNPGLKDVTKLFNANKMLSEDKYDALEEKWIDNINMSFDKLAAIENNLSVKQILAIGGEFLSHEKMTIEKIIVIGDKILEEDIERIGPEILAEMSIETLNEIV